jgi:hypothetical protein
MGESDNVTVDPPPRSGCLKRLVLGIGLVILVLVCLVLGVSYYFRYTGNSRLTAALAATDHLDPNWRWEELEAKRTAVPPAENAALRLDEIVARLPKDWPASQRVSPDAPPDSPNLLDAVSDLDPVVRLSDEQAKALRAELEKAQAALLAARGLAQLRGGRYPACSAGDLVLGKTSTFENPRRVALLLKLDALVAAHDQKQDAALAASRGQLITGRAVGDDPMIIAQLVRMACRTMAWTSIARTLAQGVASEAALQEAQTLLEEEEAQPLLLYALRGERASGHEHMKWMEGADIQQAPGVPPNTNSFLGRLSLRLSGGWLLGNHATLLDLMNEAVEIAKLPAETQRQRYRELDERVKTMTASRMEFTTLLLPAVLKVAEASLRSRAELRCAAVALAAERYRLAHGSWPESLEQLTPRFLAKVPLDPFDGKPLRYRRLADGVVVYSVGLDGKDNGGQVDRKRTAAPGTDLGFFLWDVGKRRQAPPPRKEGE